MLVYNMLIVLANGFVLMCGNALVVNVLKSGASKFLRKPCYWLVGCLASIGFCLFFAECQMLNAQHGIHTSLVK